MYMYVYICIYVYMYVYICFFVYILPFSLPLNVFLANFLDGIL